MIIIQEETTRNPISLIGKEAGVCWGANTKDAAANYKRGLACLKANHGRTLEFPQIFMVIDRYSARVMRELYTHIGGAPTRLQESTRYINEGYFGFITPEYIFENDAAYNIYMDVMNKITEGYNQLLELGVHREDAANILPLGMTSKVVLRTNLRNLIDMSHQRLCNRAYWEFRDLMKEIIYELKSYSDEWAELVPYFVPKCEVLGHCPEEHSCGRYDHD